MELIIALELEAESLDIKDLTCLLLCEDYLKNLSKLIELFITLLGIVYNKENLERQETNK